MLMLLDELVAIMYYAKGHGPTIQTIKGQRDRFSEAGDIAYFYGNYYL